VLPIGKAVVGNRLQKRRGQERIAKDVLQFAVHDPQAVPTPKLAVMAYELDELDELASNQDSVGDGLPAVVFTKDHFLTSPDFDYERFLDDDLSVERIEDIASHLWLVGRPYPPRPLNLQRVLKRDIVATTDASLHLVWTSQAMYVKALPRYLVSKTFYEQRLCLPHPFRPALGLLFTYMALVPSELDFALAHELHLLPEGYKWIEWKELSHRILDEYPKDIIYSHVPRRYIYGELRLSRLDKIYRYRRGDLLRGYSPLMGNMRYVDYFAENLTIIAAATVYIAVVLTAMQVGLGTDLLAHDYSFQMACYGFAVFAIISPIIAVGAVVVVFMFMFFANWWGTAVSHRKRLRAIGLTSLSKPKPQSRRADEVPELMA
jgi:hypothetical protein